MSLVCRACAMGGCAKHPGDRHGYPPGHPTCATPPMPPTMVYLIGPPAAGKSTLMAALTGDCTRSPQARPVGHDLLLPPLLPNPLWADAAELGHRRDSFAGTDALPLGVQPAAVAWISERPYGLILGEGDRLANLGFITAAHTAGYRIHVLALDAPTALLDARCAARGSTQNQSWRTGRATKHQRLAAHLEQAPGVHLARLPAHLPVAELAAVARAAVPALTGLTPAAP